MSLWIGELMSSRVVGLSLVYKPEGWLVLHSSQFTGVLKVKTTSLCFLCTPTEWRGRLLSACLSTKSLVLAQQSACADTGMRGIGCRSCLVLYYKVLVPTWQTALCWHYKILGVILQAALYWWIAGRMACKRNPNIHSFLWYRWVCLGITPLDALRNGTAKFVFATI